MILAGGLGRRMGGQGKALLTVGGRSLLELVIERVKPQVSVLVLNVNGDQAPFAGHGLPLAADSIEGFAGPLAGVLAGLDWAALHRPDAEWVASFPVDAPFLPLDLVDRLVRAAKDEGADMATAASGGRIHPVIGLWPVRLREDLRHAVVGKGERKVSAWTARYRGALVDFPVSPVDPFFNINRPEDLAEAERSVSPDRCPPLLSFGVE